MKQISAILIACFLFVGASQVCAQQADIRVMKMVSSPLPYSFEPTDNVVVFTTVTGASSCSLTDATLNAGRFLHIINRRRSALTINNPTTPPMLHVVPYNHAIQMMCDGTTWFVLNKSY
jgi:hypothetical protein